MQRYINQKARQARNKTGRNKKRNLQDDAEFKQGLMNMIELMLQKDKWQPVE
jgi:uncharacterized protein YaiI (UPF0178 family)